MQSSYQYQEARHADLALPVYERIGDLDRRDSERKPEPRPFSGGQPRCQICHRANHRPGEWQGHHFAYVTEAQASEGAQREARITTTAGRTGKLTGYQDRHGNPYVAFDDGSEYAIRLDAVREIQAPALQIGCCGTWIDHPAPGQPATCPSCKSVFTVTRDAGESAEAHEQLACEAYAAYIRHNNAAVTLRSQAR